MDKKYLIDTNIFITAHRETYPFDIFPSFWEEFLKKAAPKSIIIDQVDKEIKGNDALSIWYKNNKHIFIFSSIPDVLVVDAYRKIINSIERNNQYIESAKREFAEVADSWLCAYGLAHNFTIVTNEKYSRDKKNKVPIPNVCKEFDIRFINLLQLMREVDFKL